MQLSTKSLQGWDTGHFHSAGIRQGGKWEEEKRSHAVWTKPDGGCKMLSNLNEMPLL